MKNFFLRACGALAEGSHIIIGDMIRIAFLLVAASGYSQEALVSMDLRPAVRLCATDSGLAVSATVPVEACVGDSCRVFPAGIWLWKAPEGKAWISERKEE